MGFRNEDHGQGNDVKMKDKDWGIKVKHGARDLGMKHEVGA